MIEIMNQHEPNFDDVCNALTRFSSSELEDVKRRVNFLNGGKEKAPSTKPQSAAYDWLLAGIEEELRRRGLIGRGALPASRICPKWEEMSETVRADLKAHLEMGGKRWRHPWVSLGRLSARVLADYLSAGQIKVSPRTMLNNADKILMALDDQFPGYAAAGMLHCCLDPKLVGVD